MNETDLTDRVRWLGGFEKTKQATAAVRATVAALGAALIAKERRALAKELPEAFREALQNEMHAPNLDLTAFYELVRRYEGVPAGAAREHAQVVCQAISEGLPWELVLLLRRHLPKLATLFELPEMASPPEAPEQIRREVDVRSAESPNTLAMGRPGSRHPISIARPERAQTHSVVRSDNPHGDTKLSSARGLTQERERETLAEGRPGPNR